jgi:hypothetical protein
MTVGAIGENGEHNQTSEIFGGGPKLIILGPPVRLKRMTMAEWEGC